MDNEIKKLTGYDEFRKFVNELTINDKENVVHIYFSGSKDDKGQSWCVDCVTARPHVQDAKTKFLNSNCNAMFVEVDVGDRVFWKNNENPFRLDKDIHLSVIPTLLKWKMPHRLEGEQLEKDELLELYFECDD